MLSELAGESVSFWSDDDDALGNKRNINWMNRYQIYIDDKIVIHGPQLFYIPVLSRVSRPTPTCWELKTSDIFLTIYVKGLITKQFITTLFMNAISKFLLGFAWY